MGPLSIIPKGVVKRMASAGVHFLMVATTGPWIVGAGLSNDQSNSFDTITMTSAGVGFFSCPVQPKETQYGISHEIRQKKSKQTVADVLYD